MVDPGIQLLFTGPRAAKQALMEVPLDNGRLGDVTIPGVMGRPDRKRHDLIARPLTDASGLDYWAKENSKT